jgi:hypothetical protein
VAGLVTVDHAEPVHCWITGSPESVPRSKLEPTAQQSESETQATDPRELTGSEVFGLGTTDHVPPPVAGT